MSTSDDSLYVIGIVAAVFCVLGMIGTICAFKYHISELDTMRIKCEDKGGTLRGGGLHNPAICLKQDVVIE